MEGLDTFQTEEALMQITFADEEDYSPMNGDPIEL